jgi:hypothetical protein
MAVLTIPTTFINGTAAIAAEVNGNFTAVKTFVENLSTGVGLDTGAITTSKIADSAITTVKILNGAVTADKLDSGVASQLASGDSDQVVLGTQVFA